MVSMACAQGTQWSMVVAGGALLSQLRHILSAGVVLLVSGMGEVLGKGG